MLGTLGGITLGGTGTTSTPGILPRIDLPTTVTLDPQTTAVTTDPRLTALTVDPRTTAATVDPQTTRVVIDG